MAGSSEALGISPACILSKFEIEENQSCCSTGDAVEEKDRSGSPREARTKRDTEER